MTLPDIKTIAIALAITILLRGAVLVIARWRR
jgi:hypothetical protein